ncbi:3-deoxy-D-manno-octulosonic acid transferase [Ferrovibrio sp.]|uniref:3-deoxy-D-manno-octulosonic acid transferase n=1 Tax=Ferrovibrio sp. TaxID=1917215 RepID=UPI0025C19F60|nr:3-deoxy-D-manno-octulosonic acid transferase [Ferrovibrio sp.]
MNGQSKYQPAFDGRRALWRGIGHLLTPVVRLWLQRRVTQGKENAARLGERFGQAAQPRPSGPLLWCHGASVGEAQALLPLLQHLRKVRPDLTLLLTTGTVTSAALVEQRAADGVIHQFIPIDLPDAVDSFLDHWQPDLVLWSESDFWPGILAELRQRGIPALLANARLSERSVSRWLLVPNTARWLLSAFDTIYAQTGGDAERLLRLGASRVIEVGNLKQAAPPLPADAAALSDWRARLAGPLPTGRPLWLAASTHPGEEVQIVAAHRLLKPQLPGLLTMIVPRHPDRGAVLQQELAAPDVKIALRSASELPDADTDLYIADTLGELGLWYRLAPVVLMGGSLVPVGGHNPLEPARLGCAVLFGPQMYNFSEASAGLLATNAARLVQDAQGIAGAVAALLQNAAQREAIAAAGQRFASADDTVIERLSQAVLERLPRG